MKTYYVYIMANEFQTIYIGMSNNLKRRVREHKSKYHDGFTKRYNLTELFYYETAESASAVIKREKQLKNLHRDWKINLIELMNPNWDDLASQI